MAKPIGPAYGVTFTLTSAYDTAVFNEEASGNYVGLLDPSESSGLDSAEVREDSQIRTEDDGTIQGINYYGQRPIILAGIIRASTATQRDERSSKLMAASNAMNADATLVWTPNGGVAVRTTVRRQQPLRITGGFNKKFQCPLVAADPRIYSNVENTKESAINVAQEPENAGNFPAPAVFELIGPQTNPVLKNETTGKEMKFTLALASGHNLIINTLNHTVYDNLTNVYSAFNFTASTWFGLNANGKTKLKCTTGSMKTKWRDTWM